MMDGQNQNDQEEQQTHQLKSDEPMSQNTEQSTQSESQQWQYQSGDLTQSNTIGEQADQKDNEKTEATADSINWNASEFLHHEKSSSWYIYVSLAALVLAAAVYFLTKEIFSVVVIVVTAIAFAAFGALKPKVLEYSIGPGGIQVGDKNFKYEQFRSFAVIEEGALPSIQLLPHKRFAVAITMYFEPQDTDKIVKILGKYLPFEHQKRDFTDKWASKIHF